MLAITLWHWHHGTSNDGNVMQIICKGDASKLNKQLSNDKAYAVSTDIGSDNTIPK